MKKSEVLRCGKEAQNAWSVPGPIVNLASEDAGPSRKRKNDPAVKAWMDNVIVPALVQQYLAECESNKDNGT
jgi:hypothetical protein